MNEINDIQNNLWDEFRSYILTRRKQLQDWEAAPPHLLGVILFIAVVVELSMAISIISESGLGAFFIGQTIFIGVGLALLQALFVGSAKEVGSLFNKTGKSSTAWTFLSWGLLPLLLFLPLTALCQLSPNIGQVPVILLILLIFQVLSNWREAVEVAFELSRLHSAILMYVLGGLTTLLVAGFLYIGFIRLLLDSFSF